MTWLFYFWVAAFCVCLLVWVLDYYFDWFFDLFDDDADLAP